jgi:hypothetical protein
VGVLERFQVDPTAKRGANRRRVVRQPGRIRGAPAWDPLQFEGPATETDPGNSAGSTPETRLVPELVKLQPAPARDHLPDTRREPAITTLLETPSALPGHFAANKADPTAAEQRRNNSSTHSGGGAPPGFNQLSSFCALPSALWVTAASGESRGCSKSAAECSSSSAAVQYGSCSCRHTTHVLRCLSFQRWRPRAAS